MSLEAFKKYVDIIEPLITKTSGLRIMGGEPTLHPQLFEMLEILAARIRPKMSWGINICSNGVGDQVNEVLNKIRAKYTSHTIYSDLEMNLSVRFPTEEQFLIIESKKKAMDAYVKRHANIYQAVQDVYPDLKDYSEDCFVLKNCGYGITPKGIFICSTIPYIATIMKLPGGLDHFPSEEEEKEQKRMYCKYCAMASTRKEFAFKSRKIPQELISPTYERALKAWDDEPYFLPVIDPKAVE
jgi:hypothetical protein